MKRLILFDVDGTLLRCGRQVRPLFLGALEEVFGAAVEVDGYDFSGRTDPQITLDLLRSAGHPAEEVLGRLGEVREAYRRRLDGGLDVDRMQLLPGARQLVEALGRRRELVVGLLTGNWEACAQVKLGRFDLWDLFPFGAFGDDGIERHELLPVALERALAVSGCRFSPSEVVIVGDSVRDVDCARHHGAAAVAVSTGFTSPEALRQAGADWVFEDLVEAAGELELF